MHEALKTSATDPTTGLIDMDLITTGITSADRIKADQLRDVVNMVLRNNHKAAKSQGLG